MVKVKKTVIAADKKRTMSTWEGLQFPHFDVSRGIC